MSHIAVHGRVDEPRRGPQDRIMRRALAVLALTGGIAVLLVTATQTPRRYAFFSRSLFASPLTTAPRTRFDVGQSSCVLAWTRQLAEAACESRGGNSRFPPTLLRTPATLLRALKPANRPWHCYAQSSLIVERGLRSRVIGCATTRSTTLIP
jgi:hypothetical protein